MPYSGFVVGQGEEHLFGNGLAGAEVDNTDRPFINRIPKQHDREQRRFAIAVHAALRQVDITIGLITCN